MFSADRIADIQGFNRVYQNLLKQIDAAILETGYTLTEKDVLLEISKTERCTANILIQQLGIDRSYMSRMIAKFEKHGLIQKTQSQTAAEALESGLPCAKRSSSCTAGR